MAGVVEAGTFIRLISDVISTIEATKTVYDAAKDAKGQPEAFRHVAARLPLVNNILQNAKARAQMLDASEHDALRPILESCNAKAKDLHKIFQTVIRNDSDKWYDRYRKALSESERGDKVECLMEGILKDIQELAHERLTGTVEIAQTKKLEEAIKDMNEMPPSIPNEKIRILCLDGGGVKGVTSLGILKEIMAEISRNEQDMKSDSQSPLRPCDYFDLICGTSTGGLIALMLGRLEYTVEEAIVAYEKLGERIFGKKLPWITRWDASYDHNTLESCLKEVIKGSRLGVGEDEPFKDKRFEDEQFKGRLHPCRTFVVSTNLNKHSSAPEILRSYDVESREPAYAFSGKIWEAGRATSAAPTFFKPIVIGANSYSDGATVANNPSHHGIMEAAKIWNPTDIDCIVSLGTGPEGDHTLDNATLEILGPWGMWLCKKLLSRFLYFRLQLAFYSLHAMTGTEHSHFKTKDMVDVFRGYHTENTIAGGVVATSDEVYFRLNVTDEKAKVGLDAWQKMVELQKLASAYMRTDGAAKAKKAIAEKLERHGGWRHQPVPALSKDIDPRQKLSILLYGPTGQKKVKGILDAGADNNFVSEHVVLTLGILMSPIKAEERPKFLTTNSKVEHSEAVVQLEFTIGDEPHVSRASFFVVKGSSPADVVLGSKFVSQDTDMVRSLRLMADLRLTDPHDDKIRIEETKGGLLESSYHWILENSDFQRWRYDQQSRLLWIKGDPGKGKTMLLCGIINELEKPIDKTDRISYFFCQATDSRINNATAVLRGLIYMLVNQQPSLISHIRIKYDHVGKALFENINAWITLSEIFTDILHDPSLRSTYLVIDALDECVVDLPNLLRFVVQGSSISSRVKWIVSSRNSPSIGVYLEKAEHAVRLSLELNSESISTAVGMYVQHQVHELARRHKYDERTRDAVIGHLLSHANDTFLWVALVCNSLEQVPRRTVIRKLHAFPPSLNESYTQMMRQISALDDADLCKRTLALIAIVYRPITPKELTSLVEMLEDIADDLDSVREFIGLCGSFLTIRGDTVYFVHQSVREFLFTQVFNEIFPSGIDGVHYTAFARSLRVMDRSLRRDMYSLRELGYSIKLVRQPDLDPLAALRYSCINWVNHLCDSNPNVGLQDGGEVDVFIREKYLYWLEALSLCKGMSEGVLAMKNLETLIQGRANARRLIELVRDAYRFIVYHKRAIENSPLQAYASALLFSPTHSLIRHLFEKEEPDWITIKPATEGKWSACLQTLEDHSGLVRSVAFSHDSTRLASASGDKTVKVWDASSGACLQTLEGHSDSVNSAAFSHDSMQLASASGDKTVKVWDAYSGACLQTLEGHSASVNSVVFSHDSTRLASASNDKTVKIWDASSGACLQTLEGHIKVNSIAFSHDSTRLASASNDKTVRIWDASSGECLLTLEGHSESVLSVVFSYDSTRLMSASGDKTIKIWDAGSGACLQTLEGHSDCVNSAAFSHDSTRLASASNDRTVKIWDAGSGACLQTLEGHSDSVNSVAFFPHESMRLASASGDKTVKIWDASSDEYPSTLEGHSESVLSVTFSYDSARLASGSRDSTVKIWDASSGECLSTLEGHRSSVLSVAFSHDSKWVASASGDKTVKIWDARSGTPMQTLEGHGDCVNSVAFSHDSTRLASASGDKTVKIWNASSGEYLSTLEGHSDSVRSVAFSHDSARFASASDDKTVKIWDASSGMCLKTLSIERTIYHISFDISGSYLHTEFGTIDISTLSDLVTLPTLLEPHPPEYQGLAVSSDRLWITYNSENLLWLPSEYRPVCSAVSGNMIGIGVATGRVWICKVEREAS